MEKKRYFISLLLSCLFCFSMIVPLAVAGAKPESFGGGKPQGAGGKGGRPTIEVRVGIYPFPGFQDEGGPLGHSGYAIEYLKGIGRYTGFKYVYKKYDSWNDAYKAIQNDEIDVIPGALDMEYDAENVALSNFPALRTYMCLFAAKDNNKYFFNDFEKFSGMKIGLLKDEPRNAFLFKKMKIMKVDFTPVFYNTPEELIQSVHNGGADAFFADWLYTPEDEHIIAKFNMVDLYFMLNTKHPDIVKNFNRSLEMLLIHQPNIGEIQFNKFFPTQLASPVVPSVAEQKFLDENKTIRVWYKDNWAPLAYTNDEGEAKGMAPGTLKNVARHVGLEIEFLPMGDKSVQEIMKEARPTDIFCNVINNEQLIADTGLKITAPYLHTPITTLVKKGRDVDLSKPGKIAILRNDIVTEYLAADIMPTMEPVYFDSINECIDAIHNETCDVTLQAGYITSEIMQKQSGKDLEGIPNKENRIHHCIGVMPNCPPQMLSLLNRGIGLLTPFDTGGNILESRVNSPFQSTLKDMVVKYSVPISMGVVVVLTIILIYIIWANHRVSKVAYIDSLTGCLSFAGFLKKADRLLNDKKQSWALITIDIAGFKIINSRLGRAEGDFMLVGLAKALKTSLKRDELLCRNTADNFILLIHNDSKADLIDRAEKFTENLNLKKRNGLPFKNQAVSIGICTTDISGYDIDKLIGNSNLARKSEKMYHRNNYSFYDDSMHERIIEEQEIEADILPGLKNHEFVVYLQPKFALSTSKIVGAEALIRWQHPKKGFMPPDSFIPIAERKELITEIDFYVYDVVFSFLHAWLKAGHTPVRISVNVSRAHLEDATFFDRFTALADKYEVPHDLIECELTESLFSTEMSILTDFTAKLKELGFYVSIDDFGSGYSSLNMLKNVSVDVLKLDREFFDQMDMASRGYVVISNIINMAKALRMEVISEGVETNDQADMLNDLQCDMAQGYLFSKPMPMENFACVLLCQEQNKEICFPADKLNFPSEILQLLDTLKTPSMA